MSSSARNFRRLAQASNRGLGLAAVMLLTISCAGSDFSAGSRSVGPRKANAESKTSAPEADSNGSSDSQKVKTPETTETGDGSELSCPKTNQTILIFDMKSGWWSGDGGDFFSLLLGRLSSACGSRVTIEYHHLLRDSNAVSVFGQGSKSSAMRPSPKLYEKSDLKQYTQIWLLSGARSDSYDLRTDSFTFTKLVGELESSNVPLFLASGNGNTYHAGAVATALGVGVTFHPRGDGDIVPFSSATLVLSQLFAGKDLVEHPIFSGVSQIANEVQTNPAKASTKMFSDSLTLRSGMQSVAKLQTRDVIAVSTAGASRKLVVDAGLQRYYGVVATSTPTQTVNLLANIATWLAQ